MAADRGPSVQSADAQKPSHKETILDQFTRQAALFAGAEELHNDGVLSLVVEAAEPRPQDQALDVACGPGSVVAALAPRVARVIGLDATEAMLDQARGLAESRGLDNVLFRTGDAYDLSFADSSLDIVCTRFAFHHLQDPSAALAEMVRVCRPGGRIVVCDGLASPDPEKAAAFNRMERHRDPSTVAFLPLERLVALFASAGLPAPRTRFFKIPTERDSLAAGSFPDGDDREGLRRLIDESVDGDMMGVGAVRDGETVRFAYPSVVLTAEKSA